MCRFKLNTTSAICWMIAYWSCTSLVHAADGDPVAIRKWAGGMMSIETQWDLHIVLWPNANPAVAKRLPRPADLVLFAANDTSDTGGVINADTIVVPRQSEASKSLDYVLARKPNESQVSWTPLAADAQKGADEVHVHAWALKDGSQSGLQSMVLIEVDGVRLLFIPSRAFAAESTAPLAETLTNIGQVDFVYMDCEGNVPLPPESTHDAWGKLRHRVGMLGDPKDLVEITKIQHNTFAISKATEGANAQSMTISLSDSPWQMPAEWETLFEAMETSCENSQAVFAKLSTNQMNFRPSNGTHTPRWNAEHMMGRQLLFCSQIYHEVNPTIRVSDLNPKQMPPDYVAAHDDWTGAEEARQMQRVSSFSRRFAYLLAGLDLDQKAPGSRWTPRGLLNQMARHYSEHTANTVKKFDLPEWPKQ